MTVNTQSSEHNTHYTCMTANILTLDSECYVILKAV